MCNALGGGDTLKRKGIAEYGALVGHVLLFLSCTQMKTFLRRLHLEAGPGRATLGREQSYLRRHNGRPRDPSPLRGLFRPP